VGVRRAISVVLASAACASTASAAELLFEAPATCDGANYVVERVEESVERRLADVEGLAFTIRVESHAGGFELELVTESGAGARSSRRFVDRSCSAVLDAAAVSIALAIRNAEQAGEASTPPTAPSVPPRAPPKPSPEPEKKESRTAPAAAATRPFLSAGVLADAALFPSPSFGAVVGGGLGFGRAGVAGELTVVPSATQELSGGRRADFEFLGGALLGCLALPLGSWAAFGCGGYEMGRLSGEGQQVVVPHLRSVFWQAVRLDLGLRVPVSQSLGLKAAVSAALPVTRAEFLLDGEPVHRTGNTLRGTLGLEWAP
jgi:hypothetical protein